MKHTTELFLTLVQIDSPSGHEEHMSAYIQKWLKKNKFEFRTDTVGNIFAKNNKPGKPLLLCAHMDTVEPGIGIEPSITNGIIHSSGKTILGADNKAAIAAILTAVAKANNRNLELLFTVKEETGGGIEFFPFKWIQAKHGLVFDFSKPLGGIVLASPYICNFHVVIRGKAAHAANPNQGVNAFHTAFQALSSIPTGSMDRTKTTINIGTIQGGTGINTIPDTISFSGEVRSTDVKLFKKHLKVIENILRKQAKKDKTHLTFHMDGYCSGYSFKKTDSFIQNIVSVYESLKLKPIFYPKSGISDANILNGQGIQTINLSDGASFPHTKEEQISVNALEYLSRIVVSCITNL